MNVYNISTHIDDLRITIYPDMGVSIDDTTTGLYWESHINEFCNRPHELYLNFITNTGHKMKLSDFLSLVPRLVSMSLCL